jgi:hypothetical protein
MNDLLTAAIKLAERFNIYWEINYDVGVYVLTFTTYNPNCTIKPIFNTYSATDVDTLGDKFLRKLGIFLCDAEDLLLLDQPKWKTDTLLSEGFSKISIMCGRWTINKHIHDGVNTHYKLIVHNSDPVEVFNGVSQYSDPCKTIAKAIKLLKNGEIKKD